MRTRLSARSGIVCTFVAAAMVPVATASAQTTLTINQPSTQVVYTSIRGGQYANTNQGADLETKTSTDASVTRRALLKFDTQNTIPEGQVVTSAKLTVTVASAGTVATRHLAAYQVTQTWDQTQATWNLRRTGESWNTAGGDLGTKLSTVAVSNVAGTKATFDITPLVAQAVSGALGSSRYTRVALVDIDAPSDESRRVFHQPTDTTVSLRPTLVVTYGASTTTTPPPAPVSTTSTGNTLKVLQYNIHHDGIGTDGVYDPNRVATWIAKINPDVVSLTEVESRDSYYSGDGVAQYQNLLQQKTGVKWYTWDIQDYGNWTSAGIRNAILSKIPFSSTYRHEFSVGRDRTIGGVTISVNGRNINLMSTHFDPYDESNRITEAKEMVSYATGFAQDRIILGDFNAIPTWSEILDITPSYEDAWAQAVKLGIQVSAPDNPYGYTRGGRIDYVFYSRYEQHLTLTKVQVVDTRDSNGVMPSDHRPLLAVFTVN